MKIMLKNKNTQKAIKIFLYLQSYTNTIELLKRYSKKLKTNKNTQ